jgi:hypothetical protein
VKRETDIKNKPVNQNVTQNTEENVDLSMRVIKKKPLQKKNEFRPLTRKRKVKQKKKIHMKPKIRKLSISSMEDSASDKNKHSLKVSNEFDYITIFHYNRMTVQVILSQISWHGERNERKRNITKTIY